jgi:hypothetical protein
VEAREAEEGEIQQEMNEVEEQISNTKKARAVLHDGSSFVISLTHTQLLQDGEDPTQSSAFIPVPISAISMTSKRLLPALGHLKFIRQQISLER